MSERNLKVVKFVTDIMVMVTEARINFINELKRAVEAPMVLTGEPVEFPDTADTAMATFHLNEDRVVLPVLELRVRSTDPRVYQALLHTLQGQIVSFTCPANYHKYLLRVNNPKADEYRNLLTSVDIKF